MGNGERLEYFGRNGSFVARIKHYAGVIHYATGAYPALFFPLHRLLGEVGTGPAVTPDTDLLIEGFPRSGNTFAVCAFELAQPRPVNTAHHIHVPAQLIRAVRYHVPACILARRPEDAARSLVVKYPFLKLRHVLRGYVGFYEKCLPYRERFVAATFDDVVTDFGGVIDRINRRFGTGFHRLEASEENVRRVFRTIDDRNAREPIDPIFGSARPNSQKELAKQSIRLPEDDPVLARCRALFEVYRLLARDVGPPLIERRARELHVRTWRLLS